MNAIARIVPKNSSTVATAVTVIVAGWFTLAFALTLGAAVVGA